MDTNHAVQTAHHLALKQAASLPISEVQTCIVAMCLRDLRRSHHRNFINILPVLTPEETRALYRYLIAEFVISAKAVAA